MAGKQSGQKRAPRVTAARTVVLRREDLEQLVLDLDDRVQSARRLKRKTFAQLARDWLKVVSRRRVEPNNERRHVAHLRPLWRFTEGDLTKARVEQTLVALLRPSGPLGPATANKVRSTGRLIIRDAQGNGEWSGLNPFDLVQRFREPKRVYDVLTAKEVRKVLPCLREDRRQLAKLVLMVGLRPGEALGLKKLDVDLRRRRLHIHRSHGRSQTKTGAERVIPIPEELVATLAAAMENAGASDYVFPRPDGRRQRHDTKLARVLRTALSRAGLVIGYQYSCRRKGCGHREARIHRELELDCPKCGFRLWETCIPRAIRFYDLRHSSATLHRRAGADPMVVSEMLGHSLNLTEGTYVHLDHEYRRKELNRLRLMK